MKSFSNFKIEDKILTATYSGKKVTVGIICTKQDNNRLVVSLEPRLMRRFKSSPGEFANLKKCIDENSEYDVEFIL